MYRRMIEEARNSGVANEMAMWANINHVDELLEKVKEEHPDMYWDFIRKTHESLYGSHYDRCFAEYDVSKMFSTDNEGHVKKGEYWTVNEVKNAFQDKAMPEGTTEWDMYVAANACYHDFRKAFGEDDILAICYCFFFADEDANEGKIWNYMCAMK